MSLKRIRSANWHEEEKETLRELLRDYTHILENKCLKTDTNKAKLCAWQELHKRFNESNFRPRDLSQIQSQWKVMKGGSKKDCATIKREASLNGSSTNSSSPSLETGDNMLKPAEILSDGDMYDSDRIVNPEHLQPDVKIKEGSFSLDVDADVDISDEENPQVHAVKVEPNSNRPVSNVPLVKTLNNASYMIKNSKNKPLTNGTFKKMVASNTVGIRRISSFADNKIYCDKILDHSKTLKDKEHKRRMEMAEEEHSIKMEQHQERLKCVRIEREILEMKRRYEAKRIGMELKKYLE